MYHYTYRITNIITQYHYTGSRTSECTPQEDIGHKYFSSSSNKFWIQDQKDNPDDYIYKVLYVNEEERKFATAYEIKYHKRLNVSAHSKFINKANQTSNNFQTFGKKHSNLTKKKIGIKSKSYMNSRDQNIINITNKKCQETMKKIEINGLSKMKNAHIKQVNTVKNTILKNGLSIEENSQIKRIFTIKQRGSNIGIKNSMAKLIKIYNIEGNLEAKLLTLEMFEWCKTNKVSRTYVYKVLQKVHKFLYEIKPQSRYYNEKFDGYTFEYV